jgi:ribosomal protein S27E
MLVAIVLLVATSIVGVGLSLWMRSRRPEEEQFLRFRCPGCGQKLRFLASKAGRDSRCPQCQQRFTLSDGLRASSLLTYSNDGYQLRVGQRRMPTA